MTITRLFKPAIVVAACALLGTPAALAQQTTTTTALGSDIWTGSMDPALFQLHENGGAQACSGTEKFVPVRGNLGFCMDANENSAGVIEWEDARETCAAAGKRLPEPAEYKWACQAGISGLNNMTNNWEWASNFALNYTGTSNVGYASTRAGNANCKAIQNGMVWNATTSTADPYAFRCVH